MKFGDREEEQAQTLQTEIEIERHLIHKIYKESSHKIAITNVQTDIKQGTYI